MGGVGRRGAAASPCCHPGHCLHCPLQPLTTEATSQLVPLSPHLPVIWASCQGLGDVPSPKREHLSDHTRSLAKTGARMTLK